MTTIGLWTARFAGERQVTLWHRVESEIADRLVTRCGRELPRRNDRGLLLTETDPGYDACAQCDPSPSEDAA